MASFPLQDVARALRAVAPVLWKDEQTFEAHAWIGHVPSRYAECLGLRPGVLVAAATDRHRLHVASIGVLDAVFAPLHFSRQAVENITAYAHQMRKVSCVAVLDKSNVRVHDTDSPGRLANSYPGNPDVTFPKWWQAVPRTHRESPAAWSRYNPRYLADACEAAARYSGGSGVEMGVDRAHDPLVITATDTCDDRKLRPTTQRFYALVMPMRV